MAVIFPSLVYFAELKRLMEEEKEKFRRLGFIDVTFAVRVTEGERFKETKTYRLTFHTFACAEVKELTNGETLDFILEAPYNAWREMLQNIREKGEADRNHTLNTLTHLGTPIKVLYDDPDGHDRLFRYNESIQEFFNLSAKLDINFSA